MKHKTPNQRLIRAAKTCTILPGDSILFVAPPDIEPDEFVMVEPNICQTDPFFESRIAQLSDSKFEVENSSNKIVKLLEFTELYPLPININKLQFPSTSLLISLTSSFHRLPPQKQSLNC